MRCADARRPDMRSREHVAAAAMAFVVVAIVHAANRPVDPDATLESYRSWKALTPEPELVPFEFAIRCTTLVSPEELKEATKTHGLHTNRWIRVLRKSPSSGRSEGRAYDAVSSRQHNREGEVEGAPGCTRGGGRLHDQAPERSVRRERRVGVPVSTCGRRSRRLHGLHRLPSYWGDEGLR